MNYQRSVLVRILLIAIFLMAISGKDCSAWGRQKQESLALKHYILGVMNERLDETEEAVILYRKALVKDPNNPSIRLNLALSYLKQDKILPAIKEFERVIRLTPDAAEPHALLAILYSSQNKTKDANREYEIVLKLASQREPENVEVYRSLGLIYLKQKKIDLAIKTFQLILKLAPQDAEAHFYLATIYDEQKDRKQAEEELKSALSSKPDFADALNYLGYIYTEENKNLGQAETMIRKALEISPDNGAYIDSMGWLYYKQAKYEHALAMLEKASQIINDPVVLDHLGDVYAVLGQSQKARDSWKKSLKLDSHQLKVKEKLNNYGSGK